jgi:hypothetical protein
MGLLVSQTNPTEMTDAWAVTGDDSTWHVTLQSYDWKGRPLVTTLPDGATRENTYLTGAPLGKQAAKPESVLLEIRLSM